MKDLLLLPFYISAFFSNLFFAETPRELDKEEKFKIHIELNLFNDQNKNLNSKDSCNDKAISIFDQNLLKQELMENKQ